MTATERTVEAIESARAHGKHRRFLDAGLCIGRAVVLVQEHRVTDDEFFDCIRQLGEVAAELRALEHSQTALGRAEAARAKTPDNIQEIRE